MFKNIFKRKVKVVEKIVEVPKIIQVTKDAKSYDPGFTTWNLGGNRDLSPTSASRYGNLSWRELEEIYEKTSVIRAIVDGITRTISSLDWRIVSNDPDSTVTNVRLKNKIKEVTEFFKNPNVNSESFGTFRSKLVRDLLIYDTCVVEKRFDNSGRLIELWAQDPKYFHIVANEHGTVTRYTQRFATNKTVDFNPYEIVYMIQHPSTSTHYGKPVLDALVSEIASVLYSTQLIAKISEYDQVPPGLLNLGKIGQTAYERLKEHFEEQASGGKAFYEIAVVHDTDKIEWVPLTKSPKDLQLTELLDKVNRMIFRCFGITPTEMGSIEDVNKATAQVQENIGNSKLLRPITQLLKEYIDIEIIWPHFSSDISIEFAKPKEDDIANVLKMAALINSGVFSINEIRYMYNHEPIEGGDGHYVYHPNLPFGAINVLDMEEQLKFLNDNFKNSVGVDNKLKPYIPGQEPKEDESNDKEKDKTEEKADLKKRLHSVMDNAGKWFIPSLVQSVIYKKDKTSNVLNRLTDQLYFKVSSELNKNYINTNLVNALINKIKDKLNDSLSIYMNKEKNMRNKSFIEISKVLKDVVMSNGILPICNEMDNMVDRIYGGKE